MYRQGADGPLQPLVGRVTNWRRGSLQLADVALDLPARDPVVKAIAFMSNLGNEPTVELALAALARQRKLPRDGALALFALGRSAGWSRTR